MGRGAEKGVEAEKEGTEKDREERERKESVERRGRLGNGEHRGFQEREQTHWLRACGSGNSSHTNQLNSKCLPF